MTQGKQKWAVDRVTPSWRGHQETIGDALIQSWCISVHEATSLLLASDYALLAKRDTRGGASRENR